MSRITLNLKESVHRGDVIELGKPTRWSGPMSFTAPPNVHLHTTAYPSLYSMTSPPQCRVTSSCESFVESPLQTPNTVHLQGKPYVPPDGWWYMTSSVFGWSGRVSGFNHLENTLKKLLVIVIVGLVCFHFISKMIVQIYSRISRAYGMNSPNVRAQLVFSGIEVNGRD
jgi:hypothetical protein